MMQALKFVPPVLYFTSLATSLLNFKFDNQAGAAAAANFSYFFISETFWRTKEGRDTLLKDNNNKPENDNGTIPEATRSSSKSAGDDAERTSAVYDKFTTFLCAATLSLSAIVANIISYRTNGPSSELAKLKYGKEFRIAAWVGMGIAFLLRRSAMLELGRRFTVALATFSDHTVCRSGVYAWVRHGGYTANLLMMVTYGFLVTGNWKVSAANAVFFFVNWGLRTKVEEAMLLKDENMGEDYKKYQQEVPYKFIPYVY